jgi:hypothetical protein
MKVLYSDKGNVDFEASIDSDESKNSELIQWFKNNFKEDCVEVITSSEMRETRLGNPNKIRWGKKWSRPEEEALLNIYLTTEQLSEDLGRTWLSVNPKRGKHIGAFLLYTTRRSIKLTKENIQKYIQEYLDYMENVRKGERGQRKQQDLKKKELEKELKRLESLMYSFRIQQRVHPDRDISETMNNTQKQVEEIKKKLDEILRT